MLTSCTHGLLERAHPLADRIWDARAGQFVALETVVARAAGARHVILGEAHDNPEHHALQRLVLQALAVRGGPRALAMEQFDSEQQPALEAARARGGDAEALADAGGFNRKGWNWPLYRPLVEFALAHGWPLVAANLSRERARAIVRDASRSGLPPSPALTAALERDIVESHCGDAPPAPMLAGMVEAQRARDAHIAAAIAARERTVLITGNGHARRDRGVPLHLHPGEVLVIAFVEVQTGQRSPHDYLDRFSSRESYDYVWFTPRAVRADPCAPA